jgi:hypothetical protein
MGMLRFFRITAVLILFTTLPLASGMGSMISMKVIVDPADVRLYEPEDGKLVLSVEGFEYTNYWGYPSIPYRMVSVLLPQGETVSSCDLEVLDSVVIDRSVDLALFGGDMLEDGTKTGIAASVDEVTSDGSLFPRWKIRHLGSGYYRGYRIANFAVYPFRYNLATGLLTLDREVNLIIQTEPDVPDTERAVRLRHVDGFREESERSVRSMVQNDEAIATYLFDEIEIDGGERGFLPSYLPSMEGSEVSYVIVTNEEMAPVFEEFAERKTKKGVPAVVRTVEWISQNYRAGADLAETIRNFLQDAYAKWGAEWVLLAGDTEVIPARYGYVSYWTGQFIPTDMYYSCLDGNWNADGDSLWGEAYHNASDPGDEADLYSEVYIGRAPVTTYQEAEIFVGKIVNYAEAAETESKNKFLFLAEVIYPTTYEPGDPIVLDGADIAQDVYDRHMIDDPEIAAERQYETCDSFPGSVCLTKTTAVQAMNAGANHILHLGHGFAYNMSVGVGSILNYDAEHLVNGLGLFSMYLMNCTNAAFDMKCLAEYFLLNSEGGAFAVTGMSRAAFPSAATIYLDYYYFNLFDLDVVQLGKCLVRSREPNTPTAVAENTDRWTHFIYNYLGDPEVSMYKRTPLTFNITKPSAAVFGLNDITIEVESGGAPYDSALVCLYKDGDDYAYGLTDGTGSIVFEEFLCRDEGYIYVTVTGLNHVRLVDSIQVQEELAPYLRFSQKAVVDDPGGNNDGVLDSGESVYLFVRLLNTGEADAEKLYAFLRTNDSMVTVTDSTALYPDIQSGNSAYGLDSYRFMVQPEVQDEQVLEFEIEIRDSTGSAWTEKFAMESHAPRIELYVNTLSDTLPYGDNDGTIEAGEDYLLKIGVKNFGTGTAYGLEGKIRSLSSNIEITDSLSGYQDIPLLGLEFGDGFVLSESNMLQPNHMEFILTDEHGRSFTKELELRKPSPPHNLYLDASYGPTEIHATWDPPDSLEKYRYQVYHSLQQGGPYELVTDDLVFYTLFLDSGLMPSMVYYYQVTAVDSCGNESATSSEAMISTIPPQLAGWPIKLGKESSCSPKVADIDGDTHPDIVMGAEYIYAFHGDGIEMRDGDGLPVTWGILNTEGDNYTASTCLVELDENPGYEIVGASWNTKEIYAFDHEGNTLVGWPQTTRDLCWASPVGCDFDGDGDQEIFAADIDGILYAWHHDGTELRDGDADPGTNGPFFYRHRSDTLGWHASTPALADIDEDGLPEIVYCSPRDSIYCLNFDGSYVPGWPVAIPETGANISASPAVGDVDGDGLQEIFVQNSYSQLYGLNHDGTVMTGWPKYLYSNDFFMGSPSLGDMTGDGKLEIAVPSMNGYCYVFDYLGNVLPGWPQPYNRGGGRTESSPTIADIDGDQVLDIVLGCEEGVLTAWNVDGSVIPGFPIYLTAFVRGTPVVEDLDFDNDLELIAACWDRYLYIWDMQGAWHQNYSAWNGFHGNLSNTGWFDFVPTTDVSQMSFLHSFMDGSLRLDYFVFPGGSRWNLYRREPGTDYVLLFSDLKADDSGFIGYIDRTIEEGKTYLYKLEAVDQPDLFIETGEIQIPVAHARLYQNHPNPFNPNTTIPFTIPGAEGSRSMVSLVVYDVRGSRVLTLVSDALPAGRHTIQWDGRNHRGEMVASGIYFARLNVGGTTATKKMVLLR